MYCVSTFFDGKLYNGATLAYRDSGVVLEGLQRGPGGHPVSLKNTIWPKIIMFWEILSRFFFLRALLIQTMMNEAGPSLAQPGTVSGGPPKGPRGAQKGQKLRKLVFFFKISAFMLLNSQM